MLTYAINVNFTFDAEHTSLRILGSMIPMPIINIFNIDTQHRMYTNALRLSSNITSNARLIKIPRCFWFDNMFDVYLRWFLRRVSNVRSRSLQRCGYRSFTVLFTTGSFLLPSRVKPKMTEIRDKFLTHTFYNKSVCLYYVFSKNNNFS